MTGVNLPDTLLARYVTSKHWAVLLFDSLWFGALWLGLTAVSRAIVFWAADYGEPDAGALLVSGFIAFGGRVLGLIALVMLLTGVVKMAAEYLAAGSADSRPADEKE